MPYYQQRPVRLTLEEWREVEATINDIQEVDLMDVQIRIRAKARQIIKNIEESIRRKNSGTTESAEKSTGMLRQAQGNSDES